MADAPKGVARLTGTAVDPLRDPLAFREALGQFATGVTVVTTQSAIGPLGITANSFASVSLDPPLVLWSPGRFSKRFAAFCDAEHYAIHVLGASQSRIGAAFSRHGDAFGTTDWTRTPEGVPALEGCLARFECRRTAVHDGGDHAIVVGKVLRAQLGKGPPLVFAQGRYGHFTPLR